MWTRAAFVALVAAGVLIVGCSTSVSNAADSPSPNPGAVYVGLAAPVNTAIDEYANAVNAAQLVPATVRATAQKLIDAEVAFNAGLLALEKQVKPSVQVHIEAARAATSQDISDLQVVIESPDDASLNTAIDAEARDFQASEPVFVLLRSDLGLPPPPLASPTPT